ncbi:MAG: hypothetical protein AB7K24_18625 [Gemmataceae bacterium]
MPVDCYGDALPAGALARMGSARFRTGEPYTALSFTTDGKVLVSTGQGGILRVWDVATGKELRQFGVYEGSMIAAACAGNLVVLGGHDGQISFFRLDNGDDLKQFPAHQGPVLALAFTADGSTLLSAGGDCVIRLWDPQSGEALGEFVENFGAFEIVAFAPDQTNLALGSWESTIRLCDIAGGKETWRFRGPRTGVKSIAFAPDGRSLATASIDGSVGIWELATGRERRSLLKHIDGAFAAAYSPSGHCLASSGHDTSIVIWDVTGRRGQTEISLNAAQLAPLWDELASEDPVKAYTAMCGLVAAPRSTVPFLKAKLLNLAPVDPNQVHPLLNQLNDPLLANRDRASRELEMLGALIEPYLQQALAARPKLEARRRIEQALARLADWVPSPATLQTIRAVETLEHIGNLDARKALEAIGQAKTDTRLTREAKSSVERLSARR